MSTAPADRSRRVEQALRIGARASLALLLTLIGLAAPAAAAPEAHILRIDPRASQTEGAPVLTTVMEIMQNKPKSSVIGACAMQSADAQLDCVADAMEKPQALWSPIKFPDGNIYMTVKLDPATEYPLKFVSKMRWKDATAAKEPGVGTAWLILIDASASMGNRFEDAKAVARAFITSMRDQDIFNVAFFNDVSTIPGTNWTANKDAALSYIDTIAKTSAAAGRVRPLGQIIQNGATDGFKELGNVGGNVKVPMHQAMVVLSSGTAGTDAASVGPAAKLLSDYMTKGRYPEENLLLPKMPTPIISIWFPSKQYEELYENARQFMESLPNTEIGGYYSIVRAGGASRGENIAKAVRERFDYMWLVKWQASCVAPTVQQSFNLFFKNTELTIAPDGSYSNVPVGIDPSTWPLDIDVEKTQKEAEKNPIYPGGRVRVYGSFCWAGKKDRAELYVLPKNQEVPATIEGGSFEDAKNAQKTLIEQGMRGTVVDASEDMVEFEMPDKDKFLAGKKDAYTARVIIYDNVSKRTSPFTRDKILTVKAQQKPRNLWLIGGIAFGGLVFILLIIAAFRGGGARKRSSQQHQAAPPPRPGAAMPPPAPLPVPAPAPAAPGPAFVQRATLQGAAGIFTVLPGAEMKAGRDGQLCQIMLTEPRVSGTHASLKIDAGQLFVRDDNSNNGTTVNGLRIPPGIWTTVPNGAALRFGPIEFSVTLE
ncbi:MAG: FHA domain-containing protein [Polyangiaceae bacterium]